MSIPQYNLDGWFAEPKHDNGQDEAVRKVLAAAKLFAETINLHIGDGDEKQEAMRSIRAAILASGAWVRWKWPAGKLSIV